MNIYDANRMQECPIADGQLRFLSILTLRVSPSLILLGLLQFSARYHKLIARAVQPYSLKCHQGQSDGVDQSDWQQGKVDETAPPCSCCGCCALTYLTKRNVVARPGSRAVHLGARETLRRRAVLKSCLHAALRRFLLPEQRSETHCAY